MHRSEWLDLAKRVPVGQSRRFRHGAEGRSNLVVYNNPDSWSAYCHSCKVGGKVYKELLQKVDVAAPVYRKYLNSSTLCALQDLPKAKYKDLVLLLHSKCISTVLLNKFNPKYNTEDDRLVFQFNGVSIGRDCTGRSNAKWLHYHHDNPKEFVYLQGRLVGDCEPLILVEDLFSAIKINQYTGWSTLCCLGTRISDEIIRFVTSGTYTSSEQGAVHTRAVRRFAVAAFDGDCAGLHAERSLISRLSIRGVGYRTVRIPSGLDPKDLNHTQLVETFKFLETLDGSVCSSN